MVLACIRCKLPVLIRRSRQTLAGAHSLTSSIGNFNRKMSCLSLAMEEHSIVPEVICKAPEELIVITYPSGVTVRGGNTLEPLNVKDPPKLKWNAKPECCYTVCLTDPDAPSRDNPKFREWHHWLVGNIPGMDVDKGEVLSAYIGAGPPEGTGYHRYVFLIYEQQGSCKFDEKKLTNTSADGRGGFKIRKFAEKYKLGEPVAGNFFLAQYDFYVPKLYKQLGQ